MPQDKKNIPPKPSSRKDDKVVDLPNRKDKEKDENVKGGRITMTDVMVSS